MGRDACRKEGLTRPRGVIPISDGLSFTGQMLMAFSHPLARGAKVWTARTQDGSEQSVLVIVTTIPLEPDHEGYKKSLVERLSRAARDYLADSNEAASFLLVNRLRDWKTSKA
jgi:hypothetical protein